MDALRKGVAAGSIGLAIAAVAPGVANATTLGLDFSPSAIGVTQFSNDGWTLGWAFTANSATSVVALGSWDSGITGSMDVGLWNSSGTLLASTTVTGAQTPVGTAPWVFTRITPVALTAGDTYYVGSYGVTNYAFEVNPVSVAPTITFDHNAYITSAFAFPSLQLGPSFEHAWFGGNIELAAVPEPASLALLGAGLAGFGLVRRRRRKG